MASEVISKRAKPLDTNMDLISNLPREIIYCIMEHLSIGEAALMSILSHKWRQIWLSTPYLVLNTEFVTHFIQSKSNVIHRFCSIVSKLLFQHRGPIVKFALDVPSVNDCPDINQWLCYLSRNGIKDFSLQNSYLPNRIILSSHLFSCVTLEKLNLRGCVFSASRFNSLMKLLTVELMRVKFRNGTFERLIAGCPLLEKLSLIDCGGIDFEHGTIDAPNLRHLVINGHVLHVKNSENLLSMSASLTLKQTLSVRHKTSRKNLIKVLENSTKLEKLCLGSHICMLLFKTCRLFATFEHLRILELSDISLSDCNEFSAVVRVIQICSNIERLYVSVKCTEGKDLQLLDYNPDIALDHLRWAKLDICIASSMELKLIKFLLACSRVLETLSLSFTSHVNKNYELKLLKQLIQFCRASPKVEIIGLDALNPTSCYESSESSSDSDSSSESSSDSEDSSSSDWD